MTQVNHKYPKSRPSRSPIRQRQSRPKTRLQKSHYACRRGAARRRGRAGPALELRYGVWVSHGTLHPLSAPFRSFPTFNGNKAQPMLTGLPRFRAFVYASRTLRAASLFL